jgi:hypothetical protein
MPVNLLRLWNHVQRRSCQRGHVQRLADVASRLRPARVVVQDRAARGEIQQRHAAQQRQRAPTALPPETEPMRVHTLMPSVYQLRRAKSRDGCSRRDLLGSPSLTPQPFFFKLRLSRYMPVKTKQTRFLLALLLGSVLLAAQFHFCADLTSDPATSHVCPLCSTAGSATMAPSPGLAIAPAADRLETMARVWNIPAALPHVTSPRAPPYC